MNDRIFFLEDKDLSWSFDDKGPAYSLNAGDDWPRHEIVDPFPCYQHNRDLVISEINRAESILPLPYPPKWFILSHEGPSRTNGYAADYTSSKKVNGEWVGTPSPYIVLYGKRIPIMPAMTRYLSNHEYAHCVDYNLYRLMKLSEDDFRKIYSEIRGFSPKTKTGYGGRTWHDTISEIFANDVRIVLLGREAEFWPHECPHPLTEPKVIDWLFEQKEKFFPKPELPPSTTVVI